MWALLNLLKYSIGSVFWGILIAVLCMALFVFLIKGWYKDAQFSPSSYIVGIILFLLLSVQCILITGSLKIIDTADYYEVQIQRIVERDYSPTSEITIRQSDDILKEIIYEYPILQYYISGGQFQGYQAYQVAHAMAVELCSFMRWYIIRRILWCLGFVLVGALIVIKTMGNRKPQTRKRPQYDRKRVDRRRRRR